MDSAQAQIIKPEFSEVYSSLEALDFPDGTQQITLSKVRVGDDRTDEGVAILPAATADLKDIAATAKKLSGQANELAQFLNKKIHEWKNLNYAVFISAATQAQAQRLHLLLEKADLDASPVEGYDWDQWLNQQREQARVVHVVQRPLPNLSAIRMNMLSSCAKKTLFGFKRPRGEYKSTGTLEQRAQAFNFGDLKTGDLIVHKQHGIGVFEGLKVMPIQGIDAEFIQLSYKGNDRLYLPVYRVHLIQNTAAAAAGIVDKLGGSGWEKTKTKVRSHLRDVAAGAA